MHKGRDHTSDSMWWESVLLFPGMVAHELSHVIACLLTGTRISKIKLWGLKEAYVKHEEPGPFSMIIISFSPFILNSLLSAVFTYVGLRFILENKGLLDALVLLWLGLSFAYHALPSLDDVNNAYQVLMKEWLSAMIGKKGLFLGALAWIFFVPVFLPLLALIGVIYVLSQVSYLGLVWFVIILIAVVKSMGV